MRIQSINFLLLFMVSQLPAVLLSQSVDQWKQAPELTVSGYIDVFYTYDFNQPTTSYRQTFLYNHNRHNEFNVNNAMIGVAVNQAKYHATITLQAGTYAIDNYASEPGILINIYEAYAGIALDRKNKLWLDAGIFTSHLGFESTISIENLTLTHSLAIENLPYYLAGAKLTYSPSDVVTILGGVYNGWQQIQRTQGNSGLSFGAQVLVTPNERLTFNYSNFVGSNDPDSTRRMRFFNDFFAKMEFFEKLKLVAGFDIGIQQKSKGSSAYDTWYVFTLIAHYTFAEKWAAAIRGEYYQDEELANITLNDSPYGFNTSGLSLNIDFIPIAQVACRVEGRWLHSVDKIFIKGNTTTNDNFFITASIAVKLDKKVL